jgi:hypothetical protein
MKNFTSLALVALSTNLLVGCVTGDNEQPEPIAFPRSCAERAVGDATLSDGEHTLFIAGNETMPWVAYCVDMSTAPIEYLTLPNGGAMTWSRYTAGGQSTGTDVETRFDKVRIDPITLKLDTSDQTFAVSTGSLMHLGTQEVTSMPLGVAMSCGGGSASAQVDVGGTPFHLENTFTIAGRAATGNASLWWSGQTIEMWADGDCGWVAPDFTPANPMNHAGDFLIKLTYKK